MVFTGTLKRLDENVWEIPTSYKPGMRVPARIYASDKLLEKMRQDRTLEQAANTAFLPGIQKFSIVLPDAHEGYGFCIGGVAGTLLSSQEDQRGVISPGGVGYDINCGVRLLTTTLSEKDVRPKLKELIETLFRNVPSGLGSKGKVSLNKAELDRAVEEGVDWSIKRGFGWSEDKLHMEEEGRMPEADSSKVSNRAKERGRPQLGSLGSGNHFLEIDIVDRIYDERTAKAFGIEHVGQVIVFVHTGSRGYGHQICSDYLQVMEHAVKRYGIDLPDRELAAVPWDSPEGQDYYAAMSAAVNFAFLNRQMITHWVRESFQQVFKTDADKLGLELVYDVCHNIAKKETHIVNGKKLELMVHRKGATRAFPPGHEMIPKDYREYGQPVLIPGSMGTSSWVLKGTELAMELSFGSTAHGAGRYMSRAEALRRYYSKEVVKDLSNKNIFVRAANIKVVAEEAPGAYKDPDVVADVSDAVGIAKKVARLLPIGVTKG